MPLGVLKWSQGKEIPKLPLTRTVTFKVQPGDGFPFHIVCNAIHISLGAAHQTAWSPHAHYHVDHGCHVHLYERLEKPPQYYHGGITGEFLSYPSLPTTVFAFKI